MGTITTRTGEAATVGSYVVENKQHAQEIKQVGNIQKTDSFGGNPQTGRVYGIDGLSPTLNTMQGGGREPKIAIPVISPDRMNKNQNGRRFKENGEPMFTLTAQDRHGVMVDEPKVIDDQGRIKDNYRQHDIVPTLRAQMHGNPPKVVNGFRIRKLTPKECWRLQGFPDWAFDRAREAGISDSQLYKQAGNSVTVNVIEAIGRKLAMENTE